MTSKINYLKKRIIISISAIILLIITLIGITYAYFIAAVAGNTNEKSVGINAGMLRLTYGDGNGNITVNKIIPGKTIAKKTFTVKNTGTHPVENYDVYLENVLNELDYDEDLVYTLTCLSDDESICNGSEGVFPKTNYVIATNTINVGVTHYYEIVLTYKETNTDQSIDMNKTIDAKINIRDDIQNIKSLKVYGNSIQDSEPTLTSSVAVESLGLPTDNLVDISNTWLNVNSIKTMYEENNGIYTFKTKEDNVQGNVGFLDYIDMKAGETITVSFKINRHGNVTNGLRFYNVNTNKSYVYFSLNETETELTRRAYTFTVNEDATIGFMLYLHNFGGESYATDFSEFYVAKTTEFTGYEPFEKYKIPITVSGKNVLNPDINNTSVDVYRYVKFSSRNDIFSVSLTDKDTSVDLSGISLGFSANGKNADDGFKWLIQDGRYNDFLSFKNDTDHYGNSILPMQYLSVYPNTKEAWEKIFKRYNVQVELGNQITEYEPYHEEIIGKIILNEPLRKVGDCDNCADYVDIENGQIVRNIKELEMKSLAYNTYYSPPSIGNYSLFYNNKLTDISNNYSLSDYFVYSNEFSSESNHITLDKNLNSLYVGIDSGVISSEDTISLTTWLTTHNPKMYYVTTKPLKESINLNDVRTLNGIDNIVNICTNNVCASNIEVEYDK